jgi:hypothetical protein
MLNSPLSLRAPTRLAAAAALLICAMTSAHAGGVAVGVSLPAVSYADYRVGAPVGVVNVGYRGGRGGYGGPYRGGGGWGWGVGLGLGAGLLLASPWYYPGYVVAPPTTVIVEQPPQLAAAPLPPQPSRPDPVIYPRNGQTAQQLEADRQECNRWATTQPAALNDSSVFMRAVDACMDARGYTSK